MLLWRASEEAFEACRHEYNKALRELSGPDDNKLEKASISKKLAQQTMHKPKEFSLRVLVDVLQG